MRRAELLALAALHGPLELLPVSSSAHAAALTWGRPGWDGARRKELEVALHAGAALALVLTRASSRDRAAGAPAGPALLAAGCAPPALSGLLLERRVEERLGTPATLAAGLLAGGAALVAADRAPSARRASEATWRDGLWLGAAQCAALWPGVSRSGATLAAARARGFARADACHLSWHVGLPVLAGATALKAARAVARHHQVPGGQALRAPQGSDPLAPERETPANLSRDRGSDPVAPGVGVRAWGTEGLAPRYLAGTAAVAGASTLVAVRVLGLERRRALWPWALWRAVLAAVVLGVRQNRRR